VVVTELREEDTEDLEEVLEEVVLGVELEETVVVDFTDETGVVCGGGLLSALTRAAATARARAYFILNGW